jgi:polyisoprenoid-binding protein YceI
MGLARLGALLAVSLLLVAVSGRAQNSRWGFDPARSSATFRVHMRFLPSPLGTFAKVSGELQDDRAKQRVLVALDGRSLVLDGPEWMNRVTRSDDFLAVDRYPEISFRSELFDPALLRTGGKLRGQLSLRGVRRDVAFQLLASTCAQPGRDCDIEVRGRVSRHDFGMTSYRFTVKDNVDFDFRVRLVVETKP